MKYENEVISKLVKDIQAKKEALVQGKIKELVGEVDLIKESKRVFPRIACVMHEDQSEHYYWNDGSEEGLRLISFYPDSMADYIAAQTADYSKMTFGFKYR